ncbi:DnaD domain-containing protein [Halalkalibacter hemicellulosilyticus]|uniref:Chromosome replication initiation protein dnaD n=1 Tax=Halalkalibacter hemicellulosilyticusJCM 9152 TaxID=1236971 RepID=W4QCG4_9BACI|nr:DnaD domain-containing protein [Halalkalibacter hemicellulosilyticus]GAE29059.1 chromosome replication initiation protein dnaD [Halalkalibacter hemicellulosilyticusJCM 9152]
MNEKVLQKWTTQRYMTIPSLLLKHYKDLHLKEDELVILLHIQSFLDEGELFPTADLISERMNISSSLCSNMIGRLLKYQFVSIEKQCDDNGIIYEMLTLEPLWIKLIDVLKGEQIQQSEMSKQQEEGQLFKRFEEEFSRPLSPIEVETLSMWIDQDGHSPKMIVAALREAVVSGKLNFRYIDRILFEWKKNGIKTIEQAKEQGEKFRKYKQPIKQEQARSQLDSAPGFQWLEQS